MYMCRSLDEKTVKLRKPFRCEFCMRIIPAGNLMIKATLVDEQNKISHQGCCSTCDEFMTGCMDKGDIVEQGELYEIDEYWCDIRDNERS